MGIGLSDGGFDLRGVGMDDGGDGLPPSLAASRNIIGRYFFYFF